MPSAVRVPFKATLVTLLLFGATLFASHSLAFAQVDSAFTCLEDWQNIISVVEDGGLQYSGTCAFFGSPEPYDEVPEDLLAELTATQAELDRLLVDWQSDRAMETAVGLVGGVPLVVFSLMIGILASAPEVKEGTLAWLLSNGHTRSRFLVQTWTWIATLSALLLLAGTVIELTVMSASITGRAGQEFVWPSWTSVASIARPITGMLLFMGIGLAIGFVARSVDVAVVVASLLVGLDAFAVANTAPGRFTPAGLHSVLLRGGDSSVVASWSSMPDQASGLGALAAGVVWFVGAIGIVAVVLHTRQVQVRPVRAR